MRTGLTFLFALLITVAYYGSVTAGVFQFNDDLIRRLTGEIQLIMILLFFWVLFIYWFFGINLSIDGRVKLVGSTLDKFIEDRVENKNVVRDSYRYEILSEHLIQGGIKIFNAEEYKVGNASDLLDKSRREQKKALKAAQKREKKESGIWQVIRAYVMPVVNDFDDNGKIAALQKVKFVSEELEVWQEENMRWIDLALFLIPTIGFIGTVIGISSALEATPAIFDGPDVKVGITLISKELSVAFDTTLAGLVFTAILFLIKTRINNYFYNSIYRPYEGFMLSWITQSTSKNKGGGQGVRISVES